MSHAFVYSPPLEHELLAKSILQKLRKNFEDAVKVLIS